MLPSQHVGACHCGAIRIGFLSAKPLALRACQCRFCRKHGARTVSDPEGEASLTFDPERVVFYEFGLRTARFLLCKSCGAYAGALAEIDGALYATLNANLFDPFPEGEAEPVSYESETREERIARRRERWTPVIRQ